MHNKPKVLPNGIVGNDDSNAQIPESQSNRVVIITYTNINIGIPPFLFRFSFYILAKGFKSGYQLL